MNEYSNFDEFYFNFYITQRITLSLIYFVFYLPDSPFCIQNRDGCRGGYLKKGMGSFQQTALSAESTSIEA